MEFSLASGFTEAQRAELPPVAVHPVGLEHAYDMRVYATAAGSLRALAIVDAADGRWLVQ